MAEAKTSISSFNGKQSRAALSCPDAARMLQASQMESISDLDRSSPPESPERALYFQVLALQIIWCTNDCSTVLWKEWKLFAH